MKRIIAAAGILVTALAAGGGAAGLPGRSGQPSRPFSLKPDLAFGRSTLHFVPNAGQLDERVAYYVQGRDTSLYFTPGGMTVALRSPRAFLEEHPGSGPERSAPPTPRQGPPSGRAVDLQSWALKVEFVDADQDVRPVGESETGAVISYFRGKPEQWKSGLPAFSRIIYHSLWPGIDLIYSGTADRLKYEFLVHPGADPGRVRLRYRGASEVAVDDDGRLTVKTPAGDIEDGAPVAYQESDEGRVAVPISYSLSASAVQGTPDEREEKRAMESEYVCGFSIGSYDTSRPLVLDPVFLVYCGFIGGSNTDDGRAIAVDGSGYAYITGTTSSPETSFPVTVGPDASHNASVDAFVAKIDKSGTGLVYCGYIGGAGADYGYDIAVDSSGNAYITGVAYSTEATFPVLVGPDLTHNGGADGFVAKVNASGTSLTYCGYIGGSGTDYGFGIAVDGAGDACAVGQTDSTEATFPATVGPDLAHNGNDDAWVAKVNPTGSGLLYCGYIGGNWYEQAWDVAVDGAGNAYLTGQTGSTEPTFPVTVGPDISENGGADCFVAKVNPSGTALAYCGFIGGSDWDAGRGIAVDAFGNAYVAGFTQSAPASFPVAVGPDLTYNGQRDAFVAKVNPAGNGLVFCGYLGGSDVDAGYGIALDSSRNAFVVGQTYSTQASFPVTVGPDLTYNLNGDAFLAKVSPGASILGCGYVGGIGDETGWGIAVDGSGDVYVTGQTSSTESPFPITVGPDLTQNGIIDAFVAKVSYFDERIKKHAVGDFDGDGADEIAVDFGPGGAWMWDGGAWTQLTSGNPESMITANYDGDGDDEIVMDMGLSGLWLWNSGGWVQLSGVNVECLAAGDIDADGNDEVVGDFGPPGVWLRNGPDWTQLSGADVEYLATADLDGSDTADIVGDFGTVGLWYWSGGSWTQLSGVNADYLTVGNTDGAGGKDLIGDFGPTGVWLWSSAAWTQLSGVNADFMVTLDVDGSADDELAADFGATGLWVWDSGGWTVVSGLNPEFMIAADTDADRSDGLAVDFGAFGLWLRSAGAWSQLSGVNPQNLVAGDVDADGADEIFADFGSLGLWLWNNGTWSQISPNDPD